MEPVIIVDTCSKKYELLNWYLDNVMEKFNFDKFERLPLIFDKDIPIDDAIDDSRRRTISSVGYCIRTSSEILIVTFETVYADTYSSICVRELNDKYGLDSFAEIDFNDEIDTDDEITIDAKLGEFTSEPYNRYCSMISQSSIKSARK